MKNCSHFSFLLYIEAEFPLQSSMCLIKIQLLIKSLIIDKGLEETLSRRSSGWTTLDIGDV